MKPFQKNQIRPRSGFTLPEILITSTIFITFIVLGMVSLQLFGIRAYQLSATKLTASGDSIRTLSEVRDQIRSAAEVEIGNFTSNNSTFTLIGANTKQVGNAVRVFTTTNTTYYTIFYRNSVTTNLYMYAVNSSGNKTTTLLARWVSNTNCFQAEDYNGNVLSNSQNDCSIHMTLQFYELEYVMTKNNNTNYYYLETRTAPRAPNVVTNVIN
jgi:Tfp pilus assembly protein PilV